MSRRRRYRRWDAEEKRPICQQRRAPGVSVARRHALNANLIFKWLKEPRFVPAAAVEEKPVFLPLEVREDDAPTVPMAWPAENSPHERVQIVLATGHRMTVEGPFDVDPYSPDEVPIW
jgi:transposase